MTYQTTHGVTSQTSAGQTHHPLACANCQTPLIPTPGESAITCRNCGQQHNFLEPPRTSEAGNYGLGDSVAVEWGGKWWSAHVVEVVQPGFYWRVHFEGWAPIFDDIAGRDRVRTLDYVPGNSIVPPPFQHEALEVKRNSVVVPILIFMGLLAGIALAIYLAVGTQLFPETSSADSLVRVGAIEGPVSTREVSPGMNIQHGRKFHVKWGEHWYHGTAVNVSPAGEITIRYDGWGPEYDEVVSRSRLRLAD
ncbi:MAG: hypothetical protein JXX29_03250 [Deltaproteobacteria bacterium]|nr:hypothetical protein [Deltaproteobacteria bacterium]MBN2670658.1 hypothetical protein [Deltaproteobacteria bacterium]